MSFIKKGRVWVAMYHGEVLAGGRTIGQAAFNAGMILVRRNG